MQMSLPPQESVTVFPSAETWTLHPVGGHAPQSEAQVLQVSPLSQAPLPHVAGHAPQSDAQVLQVSPLSQVPSPQLGVPPSVPPQTQGP